METMTITYEKPDKILRAAQFHTLKQAMSFYLADELKDVNKIYVDFCGEFYHDSITFANPTTFQIWIKLQLSYNNARKHN
nr:MAG TPA: hypothetical protein [Bacteriophage sp.]